ncbi:MAG: Fe-S cluster assembly protein SufD, partial [Gammaproteobacteria bacterium]|nr:Fe-S cluster assembly protein SufD [Gammaproteobacteria bacterium]NIU05339.1 Fe-S cluster assembly protein SufD [Gammaproteobacteria bacterium]NIV53201.1 Fe-S cluster assembly protein SufD [Gammaproteobacteria bacterium]NIX86612.1 Fe-S cluster assembly protein SufD [Gammaproteobacteria bacterium]
MYGEASWPQLVFVDGLFSPELSQMADLAGGARVGSLAGAIAAGDETVKAHLDRHAEATSAFIALNAAFIQDGAFFHVPKGVALETPVHFLFV